MKLRLSALRVNAGLTQEEVAESLHINKATLGKWENYKTFPDAVQLNALCGLYRCTMDDIFIPGKRSERA